MTVSVEKSIARLEVRDDGRGFDYSKFDNQRRGSGLASMRDRLTVVEGRLDVRTAMDGGTAIVATIPLSPGTSIQEEVE